MDGAGFEEAFEMLRFTISSQCGEHSYLLDGKAVRESDKKIFMRLMNQEGKLTDVKTALAVLTRMMKAYYGKPVVLFIDEYDVPLAKASDHGYYAEMLNVIRAFLGMAWKTNPSMKFAVVTGCLRLAKESIFTGANNFVTRSISGKRYNRSFIDRPGIAVHDKFEVLLAGGVIQETIAEDLTYDIDHSDESNLWSILYLTGYLTQASPDLLSEGMQIADRKTALCIPNEEVKHLFAETVAKWFTDSIAAMDRSEFFKAWWSGNEEKLTEEVSDILFDAISYFDYKEDYYHAFVAGLFSGAGYEVESNSEQETGRADVLVKDRRARRAIVIETKRSVSEADMRKDCEKAMEQIVKRQYADQLLRRGFTTVYCYGAAFFRKKCLILKK